MRHPIRRAHFELAPQLVHHILAARTDLVGMLSFSTTTSKVVGTGRGRLVEHGMPLGFNLESGLVHAHAAVTWLGVLHATWLPCSMRLNWLSISFGGSFQVHVTIAATSGEWGHDMGSEVEAPTGVLGACLLQSPRRSLAEPML